MPPSSIFHIDDVGNKLGEENQLNYDNLLAVCQGKSCKNELHCDKSRAKFQQGNRPLFASPLKNSMVQNVKFTLQGLIFYGDFTAANEVEELNDHTKQNETNNIKYDIHKVLNLNCSNLKQRRKALIDALTRYTNNWENKDRIKRELEKYKAMSGHCFEEMSQVAIYILNKKLQQKH